MTTKSTYALALEVAVEALKDFQLNHQHVKEDKNYFPMGTTQGWCDICRKKVFLDEDYARDILREIEAILQGRE